MKHFVTTFTLLFSFYTSAIEISGKLTKAYIGGPLAEIPNVCILFIEDDETNIGFVEDLYDCFWTRKFKNMIGKKITLNLDENSVELADEEFADRHGFIADYTYLIYESE